MDDLKSLFRGLGLADRWAAGSALALLGSLILPWRWTKMDEELIGFVEAWPVLVLAGAALAALYARTRGLVPEKTALLQLGQLLAALFALLYSANCLRVFSDAQAAKLGSRTIELVTSAPRFGLYAGIGCAGVLLLASLVMAFDRKA